MDDSPIKPRQGALVTYGIAQSLLSLLFLVLSLLQPSETGRAVFLGQSWQRLTVSSFLLVAWIASALSFGMLSIAVLGR